MRAAVFKRAGLLAVEEVPTPTPKPGEAVARVTLCAICGSDLHRFHHGLMAPGVVMGHEWVGTIVQVGEGVTDWAIGDRVVRGFSRMARDPRFSARDKGFTLDVRIPGGYAEYASLPATMYLRAPEGLPDELATLAEPLAVAVHAVGRSSAKLGDAVVVLGAGPIGLLALQCVRQCGPSLVIVAEPIESRRKLALELGADVVLDPRAVDVVDEAVRLTNGVGPDVVFECAGAQSTLQQALVMARRRGQVVLVALSMQPCQVSPLDWVGREVKMQCAYGSDAGDWRLALDLLASGRVRGEPLISSIVPLAEIQRTFEMLLGPTSELQVLVRP